MGMRRPLLVRLGAPPSERPPLLLVVLPPFFFRRFRASCCCNMWFSRSVPPGLRLSCVAGPSTLKGGSSEAESKASATSDAVPSSEGAGCQNWGALPGARQFGPRSGESRSVGHPGRATQGWVAGRGGGASGAG